MKKKSSTNFNYNSKEIAIISEKLKKIFNDGVNVKTPEDKLMDKYFPLENNSGIDLEKLDIWCETMLQKNQQVKYIKDKRYPYSNYIQIDSLLKKYGIGVINELKKLCIIKRINKTDLRDSLAYAIYRLKIDPTSFLDIPSFESTWSRISDKT